MELRTDRPPPPPLCLLQCRPSTQKGGTLVAGDILDRVSHQRRLSRPDGYRPGNCGNCDHDVLHVHDYRWRVLRAEPGCAGLKIIRYICTRCGAVWRVLPGFIARCLWRTWAVVEAATRYRSPLSAAPRVPGRTARRWAARLKTRVGSLASLLVGDGVSAARCVAQDQTRHDLAKAFGGDLGALATRIQRLAPGARLM